MRGFVVSVAVAAIVAACSSTPQLGDGGAVITGSDGEAGTKQAAQKLVICDRPLGTAALVEPEANVTQRLQTVGLASPNPMLRLLMAQSKCFQVVDRGAALGNLNTEQQLKAAGMLKSKSRTAEGGMITVQWLITPNVIFTNTEGGGFGAQAAGAIVGGFAGMLIPGGGLIGAAIANIRIREAQAALFLTNAQTGEQTAVAEGSATITDLSANTPAAFVGAGGYGASAEGKLITAAYLDAYNKLVDQIRATRPNMPVTQRQVAGAVR